MTETPSETEKTGEFKKMICLSGLVFQQTEKAFGWLVDPVGIFLDQFPDTSVHRLRVEFGIRLLDSPSQLGPAEALRMLLEQLESRCVDSLRDLRRIDIG
jgi:hypothetical protein